ncbi:hypothetical protein [Promicromonospora sp. NPDC023805]|uniref:hypothetical protein n=1 Tax=Promicromonospora sp. NPDC023805 TaxID=3154696 RepID=UPI0033CFED81
MREEMVAIVRHSVTATVLKSNVPLYDQVSRSQASAIGTGGSLQVDPREVLGGTPPTVVLLKQVVAAAAWC